MLYGVYVVYTFEQFNGSDFFRKEKMYLKKNIFI